MAVVANPLESFVWGPNGSRMSPEEIAKQQQIESALLARGVDTSPVGHWTQGLARVADALAGSFRRGQLDDAAKEDASFNSQIAKSLLGGGSDVFPAAPSISGAGGSASQPMASPVAAADVPTQRVASAFAASAPDGVSAPAAASADTDWLQYANTDAIRNQPLDPKLTNALGFLPDMGVTMKVFSGGQDATGPNRTGSHRHDHGDAADVFFYKGGRQLDWNNPQDVPIYQQIVERAKANGVTGFGAGEGYMRPGSMHIGFGTPAVWGAGGRGTNAPDWLRQAFNTPSPAAPPLPDAVNIPDMPIAGQPQPVQVAQAANTGTPGQMSDADALTALGASAYKPGDINPAIVQALSDPRVNDTTRQIAAMLVKQKLDPSVALDTEYKRAQIDYMKRRGGSLINAGSGNIYDPQTGSWISAPDDGKNDALFDGKSVQAQGLNYLVRTGELSKEQAAQLAAGKTITDPSTGAMTFMTPQGLVTQPGNGTAGGGPQSGNGQIPLTGPKKPTDTEYVTGTYADRMVNSGKIIDQLENAGTSYKEKVLSNLPFGVGNYAISDDYQRFDQAERDFINAVLRRESGAVINPDEFENGKKQYFPQPGDSEATIEQKRRNREIAIQGMRRAAGPSYAAGQGGQNAPKVRRYNPQTGELE